MTTNDTYAAFRCWKCQADNRVYVGDLDDLTLPDVSVSRGDLARLALGLRMGGK